MNIKESFLLVVFLIILITTSIVLHYFWVKMDWKDIIMTIAVIIGPIVAVVITRYLDNKNFEKNRKLSIFRDLIKDRSDSLSYNFVNAFNLIQIEFSNDAKVIDAWKSVLECRNAPGPQDDPEWWTRKNMEADQKINNMLFEMAKVLNIDLNPFDMQTSYFPRGWSDEKQINLKIRNLLHELLDNKGAISVKIVESPQTESEQNKTN